MRQTTIFYVKTRKNRVKMRKKAKVADKNAFYD
jgi:hypothetical protein